MEDSAQLPWVRRDAIDAYTALAGKTATEALAALADETTVVDPPYKAPVFDRSSALYGHECAALLRALHINGIDDSPVTLGEYVTQLLERQQRED